MAMAAPDGACTDLMTEYYPRLAEGGIGLIIGGFAFVSPEGHGPPGMAGLHSDHVVDGYRVMVEKIHARGGRIAAQLAHCGIKSRPEFNFGGEILGPSDFFTDDGTQTARGLTREEIARIVDDFAAAAVRARDAGYDAVQLHFAHGYLGSQFLSPFYNKRTDEYGGSVENRVRFLNEVHAKVRDALGEGYPLMAKLNVEDFLDGGLTSGDGVYAAAVLAGEGLDLIEVSGGTGDSKGLGPARILESREDEVYFLENAASVKSAVSIPVALVGGIRRYEDARNLVEKEGFDYVSLCRPFIREPGLINRWERGEETPAQCISCSRCFRTQIKGKGIHCAQ